MVDIDRVHSRVLAFSKDIELRSKINEALDLVETALNSGNTDHVGWYISIGQHLESADSYLSLIIND